MTKQIKSVMLATAFAALVTSARAYNGDLLLGFTTGSGTDVVYDLGTEASLYDGETWDLSAQTEDYNLNTVYWGVIGLAKISGLWYSWTTSANNPPYLINGLGGVSPLNEGLTAMNATTGANSYYTIGASTEISWYHETILGGSGEYNSGGANNPNSQGTDTPVNFYSTVDNNTAPTLVGTFTLNDDGTVTFNVVASMPPVISISSITVAGTQSQVHFKLQSGTATTFELLEAASVTGPWTTNSAAALTTDILGSTYHFTVTTNGNQCFYRVQTP
jgi:hypothetical protein